MDLQTVLTAVESWSVEERLQLVERVCDGLVASGETDDRQQIIERVWGSLAANAEVYCLTEPQTEDLLLRTEAYRDDPKVGSCWDDVKARLRNSTRPNTNPALTYDG